MASRGLVVVRGLALDAAEVRVASSVLFESEVDEASRSGGPCECVRSPSPRASAYCLSAPLDGVAVVASAHRDLAAVAGAPSAASVSPCGASEVYEHKWAQGSPQTPPSPRTSSEVCARLSLSLSLTRACTGGVFSAR